MAFKDWLNKRRNERTAKDIVHEGFDAAQEAGKFDYTSGRVSFRGKSKLRDAMSEALSQFAQENQLDLDLLQAVNPDIKTQLFGAMTLSLEEKSVMSVGKEKKNLKITMRNAEDQVNAESIAYKGLQTIKEDILKQKDLVNVATKLFKSINEEHSSSNTRIAHEFGLGQGVRHSEAGHKKMEQLVKLVKHAESTLGHPLGDQDIKNLTTACNEALGKGASHGGLHNPFNDRFDVAKLMEKKEMILDRVQNPELWRAAKSVLDAVAGKQYSGINTEVREQKHKQILEVLKEAVAQDANKTMKTTVYNAANITDAHLEEFMKKHPHTERDLSQALKYDEINGHNAMKWTGNLKKDNFIHENKQHYVDALTNDPENRQAARIVLSAALHQTPDKLKNDDIKKMAEILKEGGFDSKQFQQNVELQKKLGETIRAENGGKKNNVLTSLGTDAGLENLGKISQNVANFRQENSTARSIL